MAVAKAFFVVTPSAAIACSKGCSSSCGSSCISSFCGFSIGISGVSTLSAAAADVSGFASGSCTGFCSTGGRSQYFASMSIALKIKGIRIRFAVRKTRLERFFIRRTNSALLASVIGLSQSRVFLQNSLTESSISRICGSCSSGTCAASHT